MSGEFTPERKLAAETRKTEAEAQAIELEMKEGPAKRRLERVRAAATILGVVLPFVIGGLSLVRYFSEQAEQKTFSRSKERIELSQDLSAGANDALKRTAALQLGLYGQPSVPVLIENLDAGHSSEVRDAISKSLVHIALNQRNAEIVLSPLLDSTVDVIDRQLSAVDPDESVIDSHLRVIGMLTTTSRDRKTGRISKELRTSMAASLAQIGSRIEGSRKIGPVDETRLLGEIRAVQDVLGSG